MNLYITKSTRKNKKYDLLDSNKKYLLSFGASLYSDYTIHKDVKLFQICAPDLGKVNINVINELSITSRGSDGFGSTGNSI